MVYLLISYSPTPAVSRWASCPPLVPTIYVDAALGVKQQAYIVPPLPNTSFLPCLWQDLLNESQTWRQEAYCHFFDLLFPTTIKWWTDWRLLSTEKSVRKGYSQFSLKEVVEVQLPFMPVSPVWLHSFEWPTEEESFSPRAAHWPWSNSPGRRGSSFLYTLATASAAAPPASLNAIPGLWETRNSGTESN